MLVAARPGGLQQAGKLWDPHPGICGETEKQTHMREGEKQIGPTAEWNRAVPGAVKAARCTQ